MRRTWIAGAAVAMLASSASAQNGDTVKLLLKVSANYRACRSYRSEATWTRKIGEKQHAANIVLAAQRPNLFRLSATGSYFDTEVACDGKELTALRTERKVYSRTVAPKQLIGARVLKGVDLPAPATRIIALLLEGRWQDAADPLAARLTRSELSGPQGFGDSLAYVLTFDYDADYTARVYITQDDNVVRRVALYQGGTPTIVENLTKVEFDKPMAPGGFGLKLPDGARLLASLPGPDEPTVPIAIGVTTLDGRTIKFADLRGKMIFLTFFFST
jgi:outer membrane lipoprotein-sorting protein